MIENLITSLILAYLSSLAILAIKYRTVFYTVFKASFYVAIGGTIFLVGYYTGLTDSNNIDLTIKSVYVSRIFLVLGIFFCFFLYLMFLMWLTDNVNKKEKQSPKTPKPKK
jgi:Na+-driven multidrug efflux pump